MSWGPEDWREWLPGEADGSHLRLSHERALEEILHKLPDPGRKIVADLNEGEGPLSSVLAARFARVVALDRSGASLATGEPGLLPASFDVVVAAGPIRDDPLTARRLCVAVRLALVEGGMFLAVFASRRPAGGLIPMVSKEPETGARERGFHEVGLQYLLRRAGFQGLRVRRLGAGDGEPHTILCMAVRRAFN